MVLRVVAEESEDFQDEQGVPQECILSSHLFNICGEHIICEALEHWTGGITIGQRRISHLSCADDTTLIALGEEKIAELINQVKMVSKKLETLY